MPQICTSNYKIASYLVSQGHHITDTTRDGRRVSFTFGDHPNLRTDLESYRFENPCIPVHDYEAARARLNSLIYDRPGEGI
jgi:hypothetical protein